jgi:cyclic 2,3-diphosphoglycerate synthetase
VHISGNLADRDALRDELKGIQAEVFLIEIKAAAIDVVATTAAERGVECVFVDNQVLPLSGGSDLDEELLALAEAVTGAPVAG